MGQASGLVMLTCVFVAYEYMAGWLTSSTSTTLLNSKSLIDINASDVEIYTLVLQEPFNFNNNITSIISAGRPRSGSTVQFVILCVIAHLRSDSVG